MGSAPAASGASAASAASAVPALAELRSLLFVPATASRYLRSAAASAADAVILDLEDGVATEQKAAARDGLAGAVDYLVTATERPVLVRVNRNCAADLACVSALPLAGVVLPKVEDAREVDEAVELLAGAGFPDAAESPGSAGSHMPILASIESARGVLAARELGAHPAVGALMFGAGDFAADTGITEPAALAVPAGITVLAAKAFGLPIFGLAGTIAEFRDLAAFERLATQAKQLGFAGSPAIHPSQIPVLAQAFSPTTAELARAARVVAEFENSDGGAHQAGDLFVDHATYLGARRVLARAAQGVG